MNIPVLLEPSQVALYVVHFTTSLACVFSEDRN